MERTSDSFMRIVYNDNAWGNVHQSVTCRVGDMSIRRPSQLALILSIALVVSGALFVTFSDLGILGWVLIVLGIVAEIIAVTRKRTVLQ
ncbi:hypothetical protein CGQ24_05995 [Arthrobacter sp. 7749]|nr:hypothetical protein CGQ24_05995 [Arthrobacter sp. 7749]